MADALDQWRMTESMGHFVLHGREFDRVVDEAAGRIRATVGLAAEEHFAATVEGLRDLSEAQLRDLAAVALLKLGGVSCSGS